MIMSGSPPMALSLTDKQKYRERLCAEVDGLRKQVEELRQHVKQGPPMSHDQQQQHLMGQYGNRGLNQGLSPQQQHRTNFMSSLPPSMVAGQDMLHGPSGMTPGASSQPGGISDDVISQHLLQRKQAELNEIMEQQRKLYSNLDNLDRQRSQILGDIDKTAVYQKLTNEINFLKGQTGAGGRFPPQNHMSSHFSPPHMNPQMRGPGGNGGPRDSGYNGIPPSMQFLSNRPPMGKDGPPSMLDGSGFGNIPSGFPSKGSLSSLHSNLSGRDRFQDMEGGGNHNGHMDKRRRLLNAASNIVHRGDNMKGGMSKGFHDNRISSSFLPSEIMVSQKNPNASDILSSSHQLLMSQREANMQREAQNMLFYQGMNNRNAMPGLNRAQRLHDGKLPETKRKLSKDFVPEVDTVVLGKGNIPKTNIGNLKLKGIVMDNLVEYANGERRKKIAVISRIINHITANNYKTTGFVKFEDDTWWEMTERDARVKITALFRDCLHDQYRSSSSSKVKRRQELRKSKELAAANASAKASSETESKEETKTENDASSSSPTKDKDGAPSNNDSGNDSPSKPDDSGGRKVTE